jgi:hypothetical protein
MGCLIQSNGSSLVTNVRIDRKANPPTKASGMSISPAIRRLPRFHALIAP